MARKIIQTAVDFCKDCVHCINPHNKSFVDGRFLMGFCKLLKHDVLLTKGCKMFTKSAQPLQKRK